MRKNIQALLLAVYVIGASSLNVTIAQSRLIKDNRVLDSITKSLKTYSVTFVVNGKEIENEKKNDIEKELGKSFPFLKQKKRKSHEADFSMHINLIGSVIGLPTHNSSTRGGQSANYIKHQYSVQHLVTAHIMISAKNTNLFTIILDSNIVINRETDYIETRSNYSYLSNNSKEEKQKKMDEDVMEAGKRRAEEIMWGFEKDFFDVFNRYKRSTAVR